LPGLAVHEHTPGLDQLVGAAARRDAGAGQIRVQPHTAMLRRRRRKQRTAGGHPCTFASAMEHRPLGTSGIEVSVVGLGCNNFGGRLDLAGTRRVVDAALDAGIDFLDSADIYGNKGDSERFLGDVLEGRRDRVVLATKFGHDMGDGQTARGTLEYARRAVDASLARLRTDRVDLLYYHRPDGVTPIGETVEALERFAAERGHTLLELAFAGLLSQNVIASVIAGATKPEQVQANVAAAEWRLTDDELAALARI